MDIESLVSKITREVMDSVKNTQHPEAKLSAVTAPPSVEPVFSSSDALLIAAPDTPAELILNTISFLKSQNLKPAAAVPSSVPISQADSTKVIRCSSFSDCRSALLSSSVIVIIIPDIATASRLANLTADRFDIEAAVHAIEKGKEIWAINAIAAVPHPVESKINTFLKEIESFGIKVMKAPHQPVSYSAPLPSFSPQPLPEPETSSCSASCGGECAGCGHCANHVEEKVQSVLEHGAERLSAMPGLKQPSSDIAKLIDHTLLKPDATRDDIIKLCQEAREYKFASCCVNPTWVPTVAECLKGSPVKTCVVIGFPLGANSTMIKAMETRDAIAAGADEVDMVINVGALKAGNYDLVRRDIEEVVKAAQGRVVKVILETALLTDEEKINACQLAKQSGADFVKTSTGFGPGGATAHDIALMRRTVGKYMGVKASGGIRDFKTAQEMIKAGATRIGASASVGIVKGAADTGGGY